MWAMTKVQGGTQGRPRNMTASAKKGDFFKGEEMDG